MRIRLLHIVALLALPFTALGQKPSSIAGTWEGDSICTVHDSPCHDEHVIYEISRDDPAKENPGRLGLAYEWKIDAYKIIGGEKQFMGTLPCSFNEKTKTLTCFIKARTDGEWEFRFEEDSFRGTLHLGPEKTLFRKISANRSRSK